MRAWVSAAVLVTALAGAATASGRVIRAESVLPPGQSGHVPLTGANPHLDDQLALFEAFRLKPAGFRAPGTSESPAPGITIVRDAYGVPSVRAANDEQLWTGVGYALAQDRLVQLELFRRSTTGTLAAVLGAGSLESDVVARRDFYTRGGLRRMLRRLPAELRARFDAYAAGINLWLARLKSD